MKLGILSAGIFLLAVAAFASAFGEWYWVGCSGTYNMGDSGGMDLIPCAISQSTGGGGSKIITHGNYYCLHFTEWRTAGSFRVHAVLYKGVNCQSWSPGDYCYDKMGVGEACNKYVDWGQNAELGDTSGYYISLGYLHSYWGPVVFSHGGSPLVDKMGFKIRVVADDGGKRGAEKGVIKQANQFQSAYTPLTASTVRATQKKLRRR